MFLSIHLNEGFFAGYRRWWERNRKRVLIALIPLLSVIALLRLGFEFHRLLLDPRFKGAIDLKYLHRIVSASFSAEPLWAAYPPASAVLLWPLIGWLSWPIVRWWWACVLLAIIVWLILTLVRASQPRNDLERIVVGLFILSIYPTAIVIGNGQLAIHILAVLLAEIFSLQSEKRPWQKELAVVILLLFALVKPHFSMPFFWIVLFACGARRVVLLVAGLYTSITLWIVSFHNQGIDKVFRTWFHNAVITDDGYAHIHDWCITLGIQEWSPVFSLALLVLLGIWVYYNRKTDLWLLLAVTAIIARIWTYHQLFDDLLMLCPIIYQHRMQRSKQVACHR